MLQNVSESTNQSFKINPCFSNKDNSSQFLFNALSQQGKVSIATEPTVVTTNNQVASINITQTRGYLAKIENT